MSDLTTYKLLDAVARFGSVRKAAAQASITPSALNRRILAIEEEYGTPLVERTSLGLRPNTAGELVLMHIRRQFADLEKVKSQIADLSGVRLGTIRLAGSPAVLPTYFPTKSICHKLNKNMALVAHELILCGLPTVFVC